jgi:hypothetical protein
MLFCSISAGLPDFSWYSKPKWQKISKLAGKYTEWPLNIPTSSVARPSKIYPNWHFWFENIPSGNPESQSKRSCFQNVPTAAFVCSAFSWYRETSSSTISTTSTTTRRRFVFAILKGFRNGGNEFKIMVKNSE